MLHAHRRSPIASIRFPLLPSVLLSVVGAPSAQVLLDEHAVDDADPSYPPIAYTHFKALDVEAADMDGNGVLDLVVGGQNGTEFQGFSLQVLYMKLDQGHVVPDWTEILNCATPGADPCPVGPDTDPIYDIAVGDLDGVNGLDIVVGIFTNGEPDYVYLNTGLPGDHFDARISVPKPIAPGELGRTGGLDLVDIDGDGKLDLVSAGNYGVHYYRGTGSGTFQYKKTYLQDTYFRGIEVGDIDGDGDEDVVAAGSTVVTVLRNRRLPHSTPAGYANNPLAVVTQPVDLAASFPPAFLTPQSTATCQAGSMPFGPDIIGTWGCDLTDVDGDGDLDVVVVNVYSQNVIYLNYGVGDGTGRLGSKNSDPMAGDADGLPAFAFPVFTPDFVGASSTVDELVLDPALAALCNGDPVIYHIPGKRIEFTTGVEAEDVNGDGRPDMAFSSRNDYDDVLWHQSHDPADLVLLPPTYDYVFLNHSYYDAGGNFVWPVDFVELIGPANDGTGYGKFAQMNPPSQENGDSRPDWLDASWENSTPVDAGIQNVFFGNRLVSRAFVASQGTGAPDPIPYDLHLSLSDDDVGKDYVLFASCSGASTPPTPYMGFSVPLANAFVVDWGPVVATDFALVGALDKATTIVPQPTCSADPCGIYYTVLLVSGSTATATNVTRTPVTCP